VHAPQGVRFAIERIFEGSEALVYGVRVARLTVFLALLPLMKGEAEPI